MENDHRLRFFVAIANAGAIGRAAEVLGVSQPAVSRQLNILEKYLGQALFRRHGRGVELTDVGKDLYESVSPAFSRIDASLSSYNVADGSISGHLRIAVVHTLNSYFTGHFIKHVINTYPNIQMQIFERSSLEVSQLVERGLADIGLVYDTMVTGDDLEITHLFFESMQLYASTTLELERDSSSMITVTPEIPMVVMPPGYALRLMIDSHFAQQINAILTVETIDLMLEVVRSGVAACILPSNLPPNRVEDTGLVRYELGLKALDRRVVAISRQSTLEGSPTVRQIATELGSYSKSLTV